MYDVKPVGFAGGKWDLPIREDNPFITYEPNRCILCARCTRICQEVVMADTIELVERGFNAVPDTAYSVHSRKENYRCISVCL
jgi:NADH dehydrogenase/NADH:ubiquinone oxidoreductase subunit G